MVGRRRRLISPPEPKKDDQISRLPDAVIHHIFSFLPFKDVVKTSVLSKQWHFAWTSTPYIHLSLPSKHVVPLIDRALNRCIVAKIEKLHLVATMSYLFIPKELDRFVCFAVARRVVDVSLVFAYYHHVPQVLCDCESLVSLRISRCRFPKDAIINWPSLTKLCIQHVLLDNKKIMKILSGCPVLESLSLLYCPHQDCDLRIDSATMRELAIHANYIWSLHIWAPNLLSLNVWCRFGLNEDIPITGADLNFEEPFAVPGSFCERLKLLPGRILSNFVGWRLVHHANYMGNSLCGQIPPALLWQDLSTL